MIEWRPVRPGAWRAQVGNRVAQLWEVASRAGKYQWSAHTEPDFMTIGGDHDWYDSREEAQADAERCLSPGC